MKHCTQCEGVGWALPTIVGIFLTDEWHIFYKAQTDVQKLIG